MNEIDQLDELKRRFIVDAKEYDTRNLRNHLSVLVNFGIIDKEGKVRITSKKLTSEQKVIFVVAARFIANKLGENIPAETSLDVIIEGSGLEESQARSRTTDAVKDGYITRLERGNFTMAGYKMEKFLEELQAKI